METSSTILLTLTGSGSAIGSTSVLCRISVLYTTCESWATCCSPYSFCASERVFLLLSDSFSGAFLGEIFYGGGSCCFCTAWCDYYPAAEFANLGAFAFKIENSFSFSMLPCLFSLRIYFWACERVCALERLSTKRATLFQFLP